MIVIFRVAIDMVFPDAAWRPTPRPAAKPIFPLRLPPPQNWVDRQLVIRVEWLFDARDEHPPYWSRTKRARSRAHHRPHHFGNIFGRHDRRGPRRVKLPKAQLAAVPEKKITRYLLNAAHPAGGSKAAFFLRFGFTGAKWAKLAEALLRHARENEVVATELTPHGTRYVIDGPLKTPAGASLSVRTAWFIDRIGGAPRFVTAHPLPKL
jgi:hypothetical protein